MGREKTTDMRGIHKMWNDRRGSEQRGGERSGVERRGTKGREKREFRREDGSGIGGRGSEWKKTDER